jgi:DNA-binding IclR family transcriptional regulator
MNDIKLRKIQRTLRILTDEGYNCFSLDIRMNIHLATLLGVKESSVEKYLKDMVELGYICIDGNKFKIEYCKNMVL